MNIGEWTTQRAQVHPDRPFLKDAQRSYTNCGFNDQVNRTACALRQTGFAKGDRMAVFLSNCSEFLEIFFACAKTGVIMVPVNTRLAAPEIGYILQDSAPKALVYSAEFSEKIDEIKRLNRDVPSWFQSGAATPAPDPPWHEAVAAQPSAEPRPPEAVLENDPLFIMYTSGTTGDPKGAVLSHRNILFGAIHNLLGYGMDPTFRSLVVAPLFHIGALAASTTPVVYAGGSLVLRSFFSAAEAVQLIGQERITYMFAVPVMFQLMSRTAEWEQADFSRVRYFISGGAPIPVEVIRKYQEEKGVGFAQGYGLTETVRLTSLDLEDAIRKAGSVGKEVFHVHLRIVDDQDRDVPTDAVGEIVCRGPNVFTGYWRKEAETRRAFHNGWFHTGDLGKRDSEGFLYLIGRKEELIITSGENVYPAEVERVIQSLPAVREAAVVAMPDPVRGEVVAAWVQLKEGETLTEEALIGSLQGRIAPFKIPRKVLFVDALPRNAAGKVLKKILKNRLRTGEVGAETH